MKANKATFGIELETFVDETTAAANGLNVGPYHRGIQVSYLPDGWTACRDGSIEGGAGTLACEIVSPILQGADGLRQVVEVVKALRGKGHKVNATCGVHVHVGFATATDADLNRLIQTVSYLEKAIFATTGTKNRERGDFCKGLRRFGNPTAARDALKRDRYSVLNICNLKSLTGKKTVEFRAFSGSLNPVKIAGWIQMVLGIIERATTTKRLPAWEPRPATGGWRKSGVGQTDVERLFGFLGWGDGYRRLKGRSFGLLDDVVSEDRIKAEFRRLARKYDAQA